MRLVHLGLTAHVVGEATAPGLGRGDLLVAASGSGGTKTVLAWADAAKNRGAEVAAITADAESPLARRADISITIPAPSKAEQSPDHPASPGSESLQPGGTLFEQALLVFFDCMVLELGRRRGWSAEELGGSLRKRHSNLE
jgi:6-phospho-3-hexuloisomerase